MKNGIYVEDSVSKLYTLDTASGSISLVGAIGIPQVTYIAFHGPTLYGSTFTQFLNIDPKTGQGTVVGNIGIGMTNSLAVSSNGTIYGATSSGMLLKINAASGTGTLIGKNSLTIWGMTAYSCCSY